MRTSVNGVFKTDEGDYSRSDQFCVCLYVCVCALEHKENGTSKEEDREEAAVRVVFCNSEQQTEYFHHRTVTLSLCALK